MKKFLTLICMILIVCASILSGCTLFGSDAKAYYDQVVAYVTLTNGELVKVTMRELIYGYNTFGSEYTSSGSSVEEAVNKTITDIINKKAFLSSTQAKSFALTTSEQNQVMVDVYKAINDQIAEYEKAYMKEAGIKAEDFQTQESESGVVYTAYEEAIRLNDQGEFVKTEETSSKEVANPGEFKFTSMAEEDVREEGLKRYFKSLKESARITGEENLSNEALLKAEIKRLKQNLTESKIIEKAQEAFLLSENSVEAINEKIVAKYKSLFSSEKIKYTIANAELTVETVEGLTYYFDSNVSSNFFKVEHILIPYSDGQTAEVEEYKTAVSEGQVTADFQSAFADFLTTQIEIAPRNAETGVREGEAKTPSEILTEIKNAFIGKSDAEKAEIFLKYQYMYSSDETSVKSEKSLTIPVDSELDTMVAEFAKASREIRNDGVSALSDIVLTEYGYHIIMYVGDCKGIISSIDEINESNTYSLLTNLYNTKTRAGHNKSLYHSIYESVVVSDTNFETYYYNPVASGLTSGITIKKYNTRLNSLIKKLEG